jgi:hypothetical protein
MDSILATEKLVTFGHGKEYYQMELYLKQSMVMVVLKKVRKIIKLKRKLKYLIN